jgi:hypothetical protein
MSVGTKILAGLRRYLVGYRSQQAWYWAPVETLVISAIAIGLGYAIVGKQVIALNMAFPWLLFFPLLIALRYRTFYGLICNVLIIVFFSSEASEANNWMTYLIGSCCLTILAGEFSHHWFMHNRRLEEMLDYTRGRLDGLSRAHYLTKLSHQHLEQSIITKPVTLRQIIGELRQATIYEGGELNKESLFLLLTLLSRYCGLISAGLYPSQKGKILPKSLAYIGKEFELKAKDPLLKNIGNKQVVRYQTVRDLTESDKSDYLAVIPLVTTAGETIAYVVIQDMIFSYISEETMQTLSVILAYYANDIAGTRAAISILSVYSDCPVEFACELKHMNALSKQLAVQSYLVSIFVKKDDRAEFLIKKLQQIHRGLDYGWLVEDESQYVYLNLMPFSGATALVGYTSRLTKWLKEEFGLQFNDEQCGYRAYRLMGLVEVGLIEKALRHD